MPEPGVIHFLAPASRSRQRREVPDGDAWAGAPVRLPLRVLDRHSLVAGATGTGKTKTLQLMPEQLSAAGVPTFPTDVKGDLSGIALPGEPGERVDAHELRAGDARQGPRPHRRADVVPGAGLPSHRQGRSAAAGPGGPAGGGDLPGLRRGQGRPRGPEGLARSTAGVTLRELVSQVAQTVRLVRSKGVGIVFVTQSPADLPSEVLGRRGCRVQHTLRAFTPEDAKALPATAQTCPTSEHDDTTELLTTVGTGEAVVTVLS